jgi:hypothetical protein
MMESATAPSRPSTSGFWAAGALGILTTAVAAIRNLGHPRSVHILCGQGALRAHLEPIGAYRAIPAAGVTEALVLLCYSL